MNYLNNGFRTAIIMSVYKNDNKDHFKIALNSIMKQTCNNIDLFLFIDGEINHEVRNYINNIHAMYKKIYITESKYNVGLAVGLNTLIEKIIVNNKYKYIARMDADDISHETRIEKQIQFLEKNNNIDVCGTACSEFGSSFSISKKALPLHHDELVNYSITRCPFIHPTVMFRSHVLKYNRYPINTNFSEDIGLWLELLRKGYRFQNMDEVLLDYRMNENTIDRRQGIKKSLSEIMIRIQYMIKLHRFSIKNLLLILARLPFHNLPKPIIKFLYKNFR